MGRRTDTAGYGSGSSRGSLFGAVTGFFRRDGIEHQSSTQEGIAGSDFKNCITSTYFSSSAGQRKRSVLTIYSLTNG